MTIKSILHPKWNHSKSYAYDIALLKLDKAANETLLNLSSATTAVNAERQYTAVGWGYTTRSETPAKLQFVNLDVTPDNVCKKA